jgi:SpoVK/Ycf46/Vps4 family AAA+-type ATPase
MSRASATAQAILRQDPGAKPEAVMDGLLEASLKTLGETRHAGWQHGPMTFDAALISAKVDIPEIVERLRVIPAARLVFFGPPGTGKSELARHIARAIGRPALIKKSSDLISAFVGESERAVADTFEEARRTDAVLILDEADSFFQRRDGDVRHYEISLVNEFLQQVDSFEKGVLVATTNALTRMDEASLRRFDLKLEFGFLESHQAMELMARCCKQLGVYESGCEKLAASVQRLAPGDFAAVMRQARFRPVASAQDVLQRLLNEVSFKDGPRHSIGFGMAH